MNDKNDFHFEYFTLPYFFVNVKITHIKEICPEIFALDFTHYAISCAIIEYMWLLFAIGSAVFAALTSILAKVGLENVNSNLATGIRTFVVLRD